MSYEVYVWELSPETDPVLVERKKFNKIFDAFDYQEVMEGKGYECHFIDYDAMKRLYGE